MDWLAPWIVCTISLCSGVRVPIAFSSMSSARPADRREWVAQVVGAHPEEPVLGRVRLAQLLDEHLLLLDQLLVAQVGPDPGHDLLRPEGLRQVVDAARVKAHDDVVGLALGSDEDDRRALVAVVLLQGPAGREAVDPGHHDVQEDKVGLESGVDLQGLLAGGGLGELVALVPEDTPDYPQVYPIVVDGQDPSSLEVDGRVCEGIIHG